MIEKNKIDENEFNEIQQNIFKLFGDYELHTIDNLALLSGRHNSKLNNSIFPAKRDIIIELDKNGSFIPICTKNVFLKYYSRDVEQNVKWDKKDMDAYLGELNAILNDYIIINDGESGK